MIKCESTIVFFIWSGKGNRAHIWNTVKHCICYQRRCQRLQVSDKHTERKQCTVWIWKMTFALFYFFNKSSTTAQQQIQSFLGELQEHIQNLWATIIYRLAWLCYLRLCYSLMQCRLYSCSYAKVKYLILIVIQLMDQCPSHHYPWLSCSSQTTGSSTHAFLRCIPERHSRAAWA